MTLDEEIKHCEEVVEIKEAEAQYLEYSKIDWKHDANICIEEAKKYKQVAEWLRELKALKDFANFVAESVMEEDFDENSDFYAEAFCRKLYKMGFVEISDDKWIFNNEEVNTDE